MKTENYILCIGEDQDDCSFMNEAISILDPSIKVKYENTGSNGMSSFTDIFNSHSALPKLIVIDLDMQGMDGKKTLFKIREMAHLKDVPVMFLSNNTEELDEQFLEKNHVTILQKPFTLDGYNKIAETIIYSILLP